MIRLVEALLEVIAAGRIVISGDVKSSEIWILILAKPVDSSCNRPGRFQATHGIPDLLGQLCYFRFMALGDLVTDTPHDNRRGLRSLAIMLSISCCHQSSKER
jgi:hypothetical protein